MDFKGLVGQRLRAARLAAGFKDQTSFGAKIGVDQSRVSLWETGKHIPDPEFREAIHRVLKTTDESLFGLPADITKPKGSHDLPRPEAIGRIVAALGKMSDQEIRGLMNTLEASISKKSESKLKV